MDERPVTRDQVEEIIARALELERDSPMLEQDELREIAREVNISPAALARATEEVLARPEQLPTRPKKGGRLGLAVESFLSVAGGWFTGGLMGAGFPSLGVTALFLMGIWLASRRDLSTVTRLLAQWVTLAGTFALTATLLGNAIPTITLAALFVGGGALGTAIAWLKERSSPPAEGTPPLLPTQTAEDS